MFHIKSWCGHVPEASLGNITVSNHCLRWAADGKRFTAPVLSVQRRVGKHYIDLLLVVLFWRPTISCEADCGHHVAEQTECACFPGNMGFNCPSLSPTDFSTGQRWRQLSLQSLLLSNTFFNVLLPWRLPGCSGGPESQQPFRATDFAEVGARDGSKLQPLKIELQDASFLNFNCVG